MKIVYKISLLFAVLISVSACKLDQYSTSTIAIDESKDIFKTYSDATRLANGMSAFFRSNTYGKFLITSDIQGDMFNATIYFGNNGVGPHTMGSSFGAGDYDVREVWDGYYKGITNYNYFINNIKYVFENTDVTAAQRAQLNKWKGEAFFFRAYSYFELSKKFCMDYDPGTAPTALGLPMVYDLDIDASPKREVLQVTMDKIQEDLDSAAKYLAPVAGKVRAITPTIDAVNALRARFYLWTHQWAKAIEAADLLIAKPTYALAMDEAEMSKEWYTDNGPEDILQLFSSMTESPRSMLDSYIGGVAGTWSDGSWAYQIPHYVPTKKLIELYEPTDTRGKIFISDVACYDGRQVIVKSLVKYKGNPALTANPYMACRNMAKILRISEMYLIKAEAQVQSGADAKATLNILQDARKATPTTGTMEDVKTEWARETVGEGMRIECLKRWGDLFNARPPQPSLTGVVVSGAGYVRDVPVEIYKYTWPIPTNDVVFNANLQQNPGW